MDELTLWHVLLRFRTQDVPLSFRTEIERENTIEMLQDADYKVILRFTTTHSLSVERK